MKRVLNVGLLAGVICFLGALAPAVSAAPLTLPFTNLVSYTTNQMTNYAASSSPISAMTSTGSRYYRGAFSASSANTRLAIQADDGSDVYVNTVKIVSKKGAGTHWQTLSGSLDILDYTFTAGIEYCIEIDYQNNAYTQGDTDGVSLYAFNGGGSVRDGIAVWGPEMICSGGIITLEACGDASFSWTSSAPSVASVSGSGSSVTVNGLAPGTATITATDGNGKSGSRTVKVVRLWIEPSFYVTCDGTAKTLVLTNTDITSGITWSVGSSTTRTNTVALSVGGNIGSAGTNYITATWNGCSATATAIVVQVASLTASTNHLCGSGQVIYNTQSTPAGYEGNLTWSGEGLSGGGNSRTNSYSTPGAKTVTVSCNNSTRSVDVTDHKVDITNTTEYGLAGSAAPVNYYLSSDSVGPFTWDVLPSGGPTVSGSSGLTASIAPGTTAGAYTIRAYATALPTCNDTSTLQVVQVTFAADPVAFCHRTSTNISFTVNPSSALSLLSFDTVTNTSFGLANTHASLHVSGTNVSVYGDNAGTVWLRAKLGNSLVVGPMLQIVQVTFPSDPWYVGVGKDATNFVTIIPTNAPVTFDTVSSAIATAAATLGGVKVCGVAPGATQVRAKIDGGMVCSTKTVTAVKVTFATNWVVLCKGNNATVGVLIEPAGSPVAFSTASNLLQLNVQGTNATVTPLTNFEAYVNAKVGGAVIGELKVSGVTVRFLPNFWWAAPGGNQPFTVYVDPPDLASHVGFMSLNPNIATVTASCAPPCVTIHGVTIGSTAIIAFIGATNQPCFTKPLDVVPPSIDNVQWLNMDGSPLTDTNPNLGGGFRVFPDSPSPGKPPAKQIRVRATLIYPVAASNAVLFRAFDVDDPYTNAPPVDDENKSADNIGTLTQLPNAGVSSDANGIAETTLTLSMQPGDNFRVVAATSADYFNGLAARQNDGAKASVTNSSGDVVPPNHITPLLTVWRRLHVEVDSMQAVPLGSNQISGSITRVVGSPATLATQVVVNRFVGDQSGYLDTGVPACNGRFENGTVVIGGVTVDAITTNILGNGSVFFRTKLNQSFHIPFRLTKGLATVSGQIWMFTNSSPNPIFGVSPLLTAGAFDGGLIRAGSQIFGVLTNTTNTVALTNFDISFPFTARDDDDNTLLPRLPDCSDLARAFAPAYVEPQLDLPNPTPIVPFVLNMPYSVPDATPYRSAFRFDNIATEADQNFWTVYVLGAFQPVQRKDCDPDDIEDAWYGLVDAINGQGAAIFFEVLRDYPPDSFSLERYTVTHEVGHLFNGRHVDDGVMSNTNPATVDFSPITINKIRSILHP